MGNPTFAIPALNAVYSCWGIPVGVYCAPDRRKGRGLSKGFSPVKTFAIENEWPVFQPSSLRNTTEIQNFINLSPEIVVVAAYGLLIPPQMLTVPKYGFLNIHPSLLPRYRGPSPVQSAIIKGDEATGVSLMLLEEGLDTGPVLAQETTRILPGETAEELTIRLFEQGARLLAKSAPLWIDRRISPKAQDPDLATHTSKLMREDGRVNWQETAGMLCRRFRAYTPWPGIYTQWRGKRLRLLDVEESSTTIESEHIPQRGEAGVVSSHTGDRDAILIKAGDGTRLMVRQLQLEGKRAQTAAEFLRGYPRLIGEQLPS